MIPPAGAYPPVMALAVQMMSGVTFQWLTQNGLPVRPNPVMISSAIRRTSYLLQISRMIGQYSAGG